MSKVTSRRSLVRGPVVGVWPDGTGRQPQQSGTVNPPPRHGATALRLRPARGGRVTAGLHATVTHSLALGSARTARLVVYFGAAGPSPGLARRKLHRGMRAGGGGDEAAARADAPACAPAPARTAAAAARVQGPAARERLGLLEHSDLRPPILQIALVSLNIPS
ncbi:hypothetical protein GWI33_022247 [Rhynchophorus ferrugineus]|uniref:Uncharacterized protein n=1 Tax=Rhynchophorus ferrugineus TaxID=354439 RepID=A0A834ML79_RHYFE|nr:hypothetical protein GWI33_022247 [Rhynchophorus ferrugineus]